MRKENINKKDKNKEKLYKAPKLAQDEKKLLIDLCNLNGVSGFEMMYKLMQKII